MGKTQWIRDGSRWNQTEVRSYVGCSSEVLPLYAQGMVAGSYKALLSQDVLF